MTASSISMNRLRVMRQGRPVYDQAFHTGVNIIRGENSSGKSTIADFIFFALGGEFDGWKTAARLCDEVQAEISTLGGTLTVRREIDKATSPAHVYFGSMQEAAEQALEGWEKYPIRRSETQESFSQIMFRSAGIPEAQSSGAANITMNQLLRLLYSDQRTPAPFLFRYEDFDRREIREAVGDLICGLSGYELYELDLKLRELGKNFDDLSGKLSILLKSMPSEESISNVETIDMRSEELERESNSLRAEIENVDTLTDQGKTSEFLRDRRASADKLAKQRADLSKLEGQLEVGNLEIADLEHFVGYLSELAKKLPRAEASADIIGNIEFSHCPACLTPLAQEKAKDHCIVCGTHTDPEHEQSMYLQIKMDLEVQIRESEQLLHGKHTAAKRRQVELRRQQRSYQELLSTHSAKYDLSISPRESYLAERHQRLGHIEREKDNLVSLREKALEIQSLSLEKAELLAQIEKLRNQQKTLEHQSEGRRSKALKLISQIAVSLLKQDLERQEEFSNAATVTLDFGNNAIFVDGNLNFAESSNVLLKNAGIVSLLTAATTDHQFFHPRFALLDNVEDKGMEQDRSHNFQDVIVQLSEEAQIDHQLIFTTSMINPVLDIDEFVIGPYYTHENKSLDLGFDI